MSFYEQGQRAAFFKLGMNPMLSHALLGGAAGAGAGYGLSDEGNGLRGALIGGALGGTVGAGMGHFLGAGKTTPARAPAAPTVQTNVPSVPVKKPAPVLSENDPRFLREEYKRITAENWRDSLGPGYEQHTFDELAAAIQERADKKLKKIGMHPVYSHALTGGALGAATGYGFSGEGTGLRGALIGGTIGAGAGAGIGHRSSIDAALVAANNAEHMRHVEDSVTKFIGPQQDNINLLNSLTGELQRGRKSVDFLDDMERAFKEKYKNDPVPTRTPIPGAATPKPVLAQDLDWDAMTAAKKKKESN